MDQHITVYSKQATCRCVLELAESFAFANSGLRLAGRLWWYNNQVGLGYQLLFDN